MANTTIRAHSVNPRFRQSSLHNPIHGSHESPYGETRNKEFACRVEGKRHEERRWNEKQYLQEGRQSQGVRGLHCFCHSQRVIEHHCTKIQADPASSTLIILSSNTPSCTRPTKTLHSHSRKNAFWCTISSISTREMFQSHRNSNNTTDMAN